MASLSFGVVGVLLGATLVWFFLALPLGLAALACGALERRSTRRRFGRPAGGVVTAGLVLGSVSILVSVGGLLVIPRVEGFVERTIALTQRDVSTDLESLERSFGDSVDSLDETLTKNVDTSTRSLRRDFEGLEQSSAATLERLERELNATVASVEDATARDLERLEASVSDDLRSLEQTTDADMAAALARIDRLERELAELRGALSSGQGSAP